MITALNGTQKDIRRHVPPSTSVEYSTDEGATWRQSETPLARFLVHCKWLFDNHATNVRQDGVTVHRSEVESAIDYGKRHALAGTPESLEVYRKHNAEIQKAAAEKVLAAKATVIRT